MAPMTPTSIATGGRPRRWTTRSSFATAATSCCPSSASRRRSDSPRRTRSSSAPADWARRSRSSSPRPASARSRSATPTGRSHQSAAPDPLRDAGRRNAEGRRGEGAARGDQSGRAHRAVEARIGPDELAPLVARADVVLDCCDNFATRHAVNRACVAAKTPLVSGAAIRFDGQVAVFDPRAPASPCYHCLFGEGEELEATRCAIMGVFAPVVGIVGATQAAEALKLIAGRRRVARPAACCCSTRSTMRWREVRVPRDPQCPVCAGR